MISGAQTRNRTKDTGIFSPLLYLLSYLGVWSGRRDSNSRPSPWQGDALPLSHFRIFIGRGRWIRTTESSANGFTVRPLWPLGNPSKFCLPDYYTITFVNVQQIFFFFIGAGGGNYTNASHLPFLPSLRMAANISLLQSPPDFFTTLEPFRVRFPLFIGAGGGNRTPNLLITNQLLYR